VTLKESAYRVLQKYMKNHGSEDLDKI